MARPHGVHLELINMETPNVIEWSGSEHEFDISQLTPDELRTLRTEGRTLIGGGASPVYLLRYGTAVNS